MFILYEINEIWFFGLRRVSKNLREDCMSLILRGIFCLGVNVGRDSIRIRLIGVCIGVSGMLYVRLFDDWFLGDMGVKLEVVGVIV